MTTVFAIRKHGKTCLIADSLAIYKDERKEIGGTIIRPPPKLFVCCNAVIGVAGRAEWVFMIEDFLIHQRNRGNAKDPHALIDDLVAMRSLDPSVYCGSSEQNESWQLRLFPQIIVAYAQELFTVDAKGVYKDLGATAIGSGGNIAYGAMRAMESFTDDPREIAIASIRAAARWDKGTMSPFHGWEISSTGELHEFFQEA